MHLSNAPHFHAGSVAVDTEEETSKRSPLNPDGRTGQVYGEPAVVDLLPRLAVLKVEHSMITPPVEFAVDPTQECLGDAMGCFYTRADLVFPAKRRRALGSRRAFCTWIRRGLIARRRSRRGRLIRCRRCFRRGVCRDVGSRTMRALLAEKPGTEKSEFGRRELVQTGLMEFLRRENIPERGTRCLSRTKRGDGKAGPDDDRADSLPPSEHHGEPPVAAGRTEKLHDSGRDGEIAPDQTRSNSRAPFRYAAAASSTSGPGGNQKLCVNRTYQNPGSR